MPKNPPLTTYERNRPIPLRTRQAINIRLPMELLDGIEAVRGGRTRTDCVVAALGKWLVAEAQRRRAA